VSAARVQPVVLALPGNAELAGGLARRLEAVDGAVTVRRFPDGETYLRIDTAVAGRTVLLASTLDRPDDKLLALVLLAATARDLGATRLVLVAPYLPYMRQDARFQPGEGVTSTYVGRLLSSAVDGIVTVDPHLHRHRSLADVLQVPGVCVHAAPEIAAWIARHLPDPLLIGPDGESAQWAAAAAELAGAPFTVLAKTRHGDREVEVSVPGLARWPGRTPVLVDDIISTGRTMLAAVAHLRGLGTAPPMCVAVHAVFAGQAYRDLVDAGARVVTCNTIPHPSNAIDLHDLVADGVRALLGGGDG